MLWKKQEFEQLSDAALRDWIVAGKKDWERAYEVLIHERYTGVLMKARFSREKAFGKSIEHERLIAGLFELFYGKDGNWNALCSWDESRSFAKWFFVVVKNHTNRLIKEELGQKNMISLEAHNQDNAGPRLDPPAAEANPDDVITFFQLLEKLGPPCTQILRLKYYEGLSDEAIAKTVGHARKWVNRKKNECLERLRSEYTPEEIR